jgi:hypothetical protein
VISRAPLTNAKGTELGFHGNTGSALHRTYYIDALQSLGYRVIIAEYPGYGVHSGTPSEAALIKDGIVTAKMAWHEFKEPLPAYPATEQLVLGNRLLKIASWIHVQAYDKTAKANICMQMA